MEDSSSSNATAANENTSLSLHPQVIPLDHEACSVDIIDWSDDSRIAVATKKGVYCLSLLSSADHIDKNFKMQKTFIPVSAKTKGGSGANLSEGYRHGQVIATENGYRTVRWSPLECGANGRCLLTTLTLDHRLVLHCLQHNQLQWQEVLDFSALESSPKASAKSDKGSAKLFATDMQWSETFCKTKDCDTGNGFELDRHVMLAVATSSGQVVVWGFKCPIVDHTSAVVQQQIETPSKCITCLAWVQQENNPPGGIAVGHLDGTISIWPIAVDAGSPTFLTTPTVIWKEQDLVAVTSMKSRPLEKSGSILVASKGPYVMCFEIQNSGDNITLLHTAWTDAIHPMPISGLALSAEHKIYTCCMGSTMTVTNIRRNESGLSLEAFPIDTKSSLLKRGYGITRSKNSVFLGCVSGLTDTLNGVVKLQMNFLQLKSQEEVTAALVSPKTGSLAHNIDLVEYVRQRSSSDRSLPPDLQSILYEEPPKTHPHLQFFLLKLSIALEKEKEDLADEGTVKDLEDTLARVTTFLAVKHIQSMFGREETGSSMSPLMRTILEWLKKEGHGNTDLPATTSVTEHLAEICKLCQGPIEFEDVRAATCKNGHSWERCCLTFAACQVVPYRKCKLCGAAALPKTARGSREICPELLMSNSCTFCSGNLL
ncbi:general transcription factor 3C polypeptide 4-like [Branchiostoma lanceolatum]|uniref:general transcription factor 3C polypeptide 4-like n=1 Tax=Branchiostoma lanceolatum TaxID=7740 RepID=UPI0034511236